MSEILPITLEDGRTILVEAEPGDLTKVPVTSKQTRSSRVPQGAEETGVADKLKESVELLKDQIAAVADTVNQALKDNRPDELKVELNIGFTGESQPIPFLLKGEANGGLKITATWKK